MPTIRLKTEIPGPASRVLTERRTHAVPRGVYASAPVFIRHAEGAVLEDVDGNRFIDLAGGIGTINVGHRNPRVLAAVHRQLDAFLHLCFSVTGYEPYVELAEKLNALTPGHFAKKTLLVNSGAEAVENAVKIARAYTRRPAILCVEDAFHGRTMLGMSLTSKTHPYKHGFGPFLSDVYRIPYGLPAAARIRERLSMSHEDVEQLLDHTFRRVVAAESVAAVIIEPVLGEGGFVVPPAGFLPALADICRRHGIVFIADEVQTGCRPHWRAFRMHALSASSPTSSSPQNLSGEGCHSLASLAAQKSWTRRFLGGIGGTFGGNPASCAAALAVIEEFADGSLLALARSLGERFQRRAYAWQRQHPFIGDVRGLGAMQAIEFVDRDGAPWAAPAKKLAQHCLRSGVLVLTAGTYDNVIRLLMPLVISDEQFHEALEVMERNLNAVAAELGEMAVVAN